MTGKIRAKNKMKVKTDIDYLEVPKELEKYFGKDDDNFIISDLCEKFENKITTKEIAYFISNFYTSLIPGEGGYAIWDCLDFEEEEYKYGVIVFGWSSEISDKGPIHMIGWKEKKEQELLQ